jgi:hypothetical protein
MKLGPYILGYNDTQERGIYTGAAQELAESVPSESVDMVFCDPPYTKEFIPHIYEWLGSATLRILKPGGYLFAYCGGEHMPASLAALDESGLSYFWVFMLVHNGGYPRMWNKHLMSGYKPVFVFTKGKPTINPWMSTVHSDAMDKRYHGWGQGDGLAIKMINMLTVEGDVVFDPFAGGGTTSAAAKKLRRQYLAFEIEPEIASVARERLRNTQLPLFVTEHEQLPLCWDSTELADKPFSFNKKDVEETLPYED